MIKKLINSISGREIKKDEKKSLHFIFRELKNGFNFIKKYPQSVSIFGSARFSPDNPYYKQAEELARKISHELHYTVITGGGPGIMEAANKGAFGARGSSVGLSVVLPREQHTNPFVHDEMLFQHFFIRKTMLTFAAEAYVFFPGGFGTFDELFSILTLIQTKKIPKVPVFLVGVDYWSKLDQFIQSETIERLKAVSPEEHDLYMITDSMDAVITKIRENPVQNWWKDFEMTS